MSLARYFVFERERDWLVTLDGAPIGRHHSRSTAVNSAIVMADLMGSMRHDADVMVESDGQLEIAWTYGIDPVPQLRGEAA
ncbi:MAG: hypothetical protein ABIY37_09835 [Devosia sp.]